MYLGSSTNSGILSLPFEKTFCTSERLACNPRLLVTVIINLIIDSSDNSKKFPVLIWVSSSPHTTRQTLYLFIWQLRYLFSFNKILLRKTFSQLGLFTFVQKFIFFRVCRLFFIACRHFGTSVLFSASFGRSASSLRIPLKAFILRITVTCLRLRDNVFPSWPDRRLMMRLFMHMVLDLHTSYLPRLALCHSVCRVMLLSPAWFLPYSSDN